jgi:uncharacterized protein (TIGR02217 family)
MSNAVYPTLPGLGFNFTRTPMWNTIVQKAVSGEEVRAATQVYPRYQYTLTYDLLRSAAAYGEMQTLLGFYNARQGSFDTFLFTDPDDNSITGQQIGIGDGSTKTFQLLRALGGFNDIIQAPNVVSTVYLTGVAQSGGSWSVDATTGLLTFTTAPAAGKVIAVDFTYYWRCRFVDDQYDFDKFMSQLWSVGQIQFITVKNETS